MTAGAATEVQPQVPDDAWTVVGGGAVGGLLAAALHTAGHPVRIVDTDRAHVHAIQQRGLVIRGADGTERTARVPAVHPDDAPAELVLKRVLLAVKAQATGTAVAWIAPRLADDGFVISAQNGFGEYTIAEVVGAHRTVGCFINLFADLVEPGVVSDGGGGTVVLGELGGTTSPRVDRAVGELSAWGPVSASDNVLGHLWSKLAYTAAAAAGSLTNDPIFEVLERETASTLALVHEVYQVALAVGARPASFDAWEAPFLLPGADPEAARAALARMCGWLGQQPKVRTGIWRDLVVRRRPTEVPALLVPVLATATEHGLMCPGIRALLIVFHDVEAGRTTIGPRTYDPIRAAVAGPGEDLA